jgi:WhiB family redox-sensing transcriptional regulator
VEFVTNFPNKKSIDSAPSTRHSSGKRNGHSAVTKGYPTPLRQGLSAGIIRWSQGEHLPMSIATEWAAQAACRTTDPDTLFVQGAAQNRVKAICLGCDVRTECLSDALDNRVEFGVWGGMTERERRALLRRRPNVSSWRTLLMSAQTEYERQSLLSSSDRAS